MVFLVLWSDWFRHHGFLSLEAQVTALGMPITVNSCGWADYFTQTVSEHGSYWA